MGALFKLIFILACVFVIVFIIMPKREYEKEHRTTKLGDSKMLDGQPWTSGKQNIAMRLVAHNNSLLTGTMAKSKIIPFDKFDFLMSNDDAYHAYNECLINAICLKIGWVEKSINKNKNPFDFYNNHFKYLENDFYKTHSNKLRNEDELYKYESQFSDYYYTLKYSINDSVDLRKIWAMDNKRFY